MNFPELLAAMRETETGLDGHVPQEWLQGRTAYGGLSAAVALHAAQQKLETLPPLRSAQVAFVGPIAGDIRVEPVPLRIGRTASFVQSDIHFDKDGDWTLGLKTLFVCMDERESAIDHVQADYPPVPPPDIGKATTRATSLSFLQHFEFADVKDVEGQGPADYLRWIRLRDRADIDPMVELMLIADALPPAAMRLVDGFGPISSITWQVNILTTTPQTDDGWWLLRSRSDYARHGASSQVMSVWNTRGEQIVTGMQGVALFL
ncbi:acyl-CoA thioesterase [Parasphingopyxis marina]|nr:thioesterase family protein [Parasphingopyxis marina]